MKKKILLVFLMIFAISAFFIACSPNKDQGEKYTITFDVNFDGGADYTKEINHGDSLGDLAGYLGQDRGESFWFVGWQQSPTSNFIQADDTYTFVENITLTAVWYDATLHNALIKTINEDSYAITNDLGEAAVYQDGELIEGFSDRYGNEIWFDRGDLYLTEEYRGSLNLLIEDYDFERGSIYTPISKNYFLDQGYDGVFWRVGDDDFLNLKQNLQRDYLFYQFEETSEGYEYNNAVFTVQDGYLTGLKCETQPFYETQPYNAEYRLYFDIPSDIIPAKTKTYIKGFALYFENASDNENDTMTVTVGSVSTIINVTRSDHYFPLYYDVKLSEVRQQVNAAYYTDAGAYLTWIHYDITRYYLDRECTNEITDDFYLTSDTVVYVKGETAL